jgi:hypothetical protein
VKYVCLVYGEEQAMATVADRECLACGDGLRKDGKFLAGEALHPVRTAKSVRVRNGKVTVTDGPFTETKELLAGFYLIDARDMDEAIRIASKIPPARIGTIEVRQVRELQP